MKIYVQICKTVYKTIPFNTLAKPESALFANVP